MQQHDSLLLRWTLNAFTTAFKKFLIGFLQKMGLPKEMDFNEVDQAFVSSGAHKRNIMSKKVIKYQNNRWKFL